MKTKKIPMRMCVGCGQVKPKAELTRVVKTPDDQVLIDSKGKMNGRGAYLFNPFFFFFFWYFSFLTSTGAGQGRE